MRGDALKGHLDLLVLSVLAPRPLHGYAVIETLRDSSEQAFDLPEGTIYPVLHRLERAGMLSSDWKVHGGRRRRTYRLTDAGRRELRAERAAWAEFAAAVSRIVEEPRWKAT